jgi:Fe-S cluster assembly ATP-binding protein
MSENLLEIKELFVRAGEVEILKNLNLSLQKGQFHILMGPNGSGKSTLANVIMGQPDYEVVKGEIYFESKLINTLKVDERARLGIFLGFQNPVEVSGVPIYQFLRQALSARSGLTISVLEARMKTNEWAKTLAIDPKLTARYLNDGFSGGEKKKNELLQLAVLQPKLALLDETDTGLDVDAINTLNKGLALIREKNPEMTIIYITHYDSVLRLLSPDKVHLMISGTIVESGDKSLAHEVLKRGYKHWT